MDPVTLALAGQGILGLGQGIAGLFGASKNKAPEYKMPTEYNQNLAEAQMRAAGGLPAASKALAQDQMARGTAAGLAKLQSRNSLGTGVAGIAQAQADQANKLAAMDAEARLRGEAQVAGARAAIANAKDKAFMIKQQDYLRKAQANANLLSGGIQNVVGGLQSYAMMDMMKKYYASLANAGAGKGAGAGVGEGIDTGGAGANIAPPMFNYKNPMTGLDAESGFTNEIGGINF